MTNFAESHVEEAALAWLAELGYQVVPGPELAFGQPGAEREDPSYRDVLLAGRLRAALFRLNPQLPTEAVDEAFRKLTRADDLEHWERGKAVWFSSVKAFKGPEADILILIESGDFHDTFFMKFGTDDRVGKTAESFLSHLFAKAEEAGIMVLKCGTVRGNPHRPLNPEEFQGFALCDELAPLIFINGADFQAAQVFTFAHEIAHLWIGQSGISAQTLVPDAKAHASVEQVCNEVAAEVLVPRQELCARWQRDDGVSRNSEREARHFKVSAVVVARRALNAHLIRNDEYLAYYKAQVKLWQGSPKPDRSGGDYYKSVPIRVGRTFAGTVVREALEGRLLFRDAAQLLNINPGKISELAKELVVR